MCNSSATHIDPASLRLLMTERKPLGLIDLSAQALIYFLIDLKASDRRSDTYPVLF